MNRYHNAARSRSHAPLLSVITESHLPSIKRASFKGIEGCQLIKPLGSGSYGNVYHVRFLNSNDEAALKIFDTGKSAKTDRIEYYTERNILRAIASMEKGFGIKLQIAHWRDDILGIECPKLMLEFVPGTNMEQISLRALPFSSVIGFVLKMMKQMDNVLNWLHKFNIYHNDIKPANIMYNTVKDEFILIDFGLVVPLSLLHTSTKFRDISFWTTITFMSPYHFDLIKKKELADDERTRTKAACADYYSLGLTAIRIIGMNCVRKYMVYSLCIMARTIIEVQQNYTKQDQVEYPSWSREQIRHRLMPFWCTVQQEIMGQAQKLPSGIENVGELVRILSEWMALAPEYFSYSRNECVYHGSSTNSDMYSSFQSDLNADVYTSSEDH